MHPGKMNKDQLGSSEHRIHQDKSGSGMMVKVYQDDSLVRVGKGATGVIKFIEAIDIEYI